MPICIIISSMHLEKAKALQLLFIILKILTERKILDGLILPSEKVE